MKLTTVLAITALAVVVGCADAPLRDMNAPIIRGVTIEPMKVGLDYSEFTEFDIAFNGMRAAVKANTPSFRREVHRVGAGNFLENGAAMFPNYEPLYEKALLKALPCPCHVTGNEPDFNHFTFLFGYTCP